MFFKIFIQVEKALQAVEKLVLAMPEELDLHAADLAHALLHVKCSSVAVEGEEDVAERRQQQALVVLLSCSPVKTVTSLTAELFSPHIDVSQRILILQVMAGKTFFLLHSTFLESTSTLGKNWSR